MRGCAPRDCNSCGLPWACMSSCGPAAWANYWNWASWTLRLLRAYCFLPSTECRPGDAPSSETPPCNKPSAAPPPPGRAAVRGGGVCCAVAGRGRRVGRAAGDEAAGAGRHARRRLLQCAAGPFACVAIGACQCAHPGRAFVWLGKPCALVPVDGMMPRNPPRHVQRSISSPPLCSCILSCPILLYIYPPIHARPPAGAAPQETELTEALDSQLRGHRPRAGRVEEEARAERRWEDGGGKGGGARRRGIHA